MRDELDAILANNGKDALLICSSSQKDANMFYVTEFLAPDPFIFLKKTGEEPIIVINDMEFERAKKQSIVKDIRSYSDYNYKKIMKSAKDTNLSSIQFIAKIVKKELDKSNKICVPINFPLVVADVLRGQDLTLDPMFGILEKARETKDSKEIEIIYEIQKINEKITSEAINLIANSDIGSNKTLYKNGKPLTVGILKSFFGQKLIEKGCIPEEDIIIACGKKSSDPHYLGDTEDKLKADQPIILDIYSQSLQKRYWTDMTRTIVKGNASNKIKNMFETIFEAKNSSLDAIKSGALGNEIYDICCDIIEKAGYETTRKEKKVNNGMNHGLGHGVGLQIHENPRMNEYSKSPLNEHVIVTVEPGLYNQHIGGVRLEDIIEITKNGYHNLTKMDTILEV
ncbi:MAG: Xaa-Pro peptidase family protein [Candidatus Bathyarchaeota archaeon]